MINVKFILRKLKIFVTISICIALFLSMYEVKSIYTIFERDSYFRKYVKNDQQIYFIGTDHSMSLDSSPYSYLNLKAAIENIKPDIVLIESRSEQISNGNYGDGPFEMLYCHLTADNLSIPVKGVDWWNTTDPINKPESMNYKRDNYINKNILKDIVGHKKVLILMGSGHVLAEEPKLESAGYKRTFFSEIDKLKLFKVKDKKLVYPKGMNYYVKNRINYEKESIGIVYKTEIYKKQAQIVINDLNRLSKSISETGEE